MDILADTNVVLRRLHRLHPQHVAVRDALQKLTDGGHRICVTSQNLIECWVVCTRPVENNGYGLMPNLTARVLGSIERAVFRLPDSDDVMPSSGDSFRFMAYPGKKLMTPESWPQ